MTSSDISSDSLFRQISAEKKPQGYKKKHKSPVWRDVSSKSPEKIQGVVSIVRPKPIWEDKKLIKKFNKEMSYLRRMKSEEKKSKTNNAAGRRGRKTRKTRKTRRHKNQKKSRTYKK